MACLLLFFLGGGVHNDIKTIIITSEPSSGIKHISTLKVFILFFRRQKNVKLTIDSFDDTVQMWNMV